MVRHPHVRVDVDRTVALVQSGEDHGLLVHALHDLRLGTHLADDDFPEHVADGFRSVPTQIAEHHLLLSLRGACQESRDRSGGCK